MRVGNVGTVAASADDDPEARAFAALYREHYPAVVRLAFLLTGSNETAEDVAQDVFVRTRRRLPGLDHPASYLRAAVVNACRSLHRRDRLARRLLAPAAEPEALVLPSELAELRDALAALPARQRAAVVLRYFCDLPDGEIARALDCRPATVRSLVRRGLAQLREVIE